MNKDDLKEDDGGAGAVGGTTAACGAIPSGVVATVDPSGQRKRKRRKKLTEAQRLIRMYELVHCPIPLLSGEEHAVAKAFTGTPKLQNKVPLVTVKTADLKPTQWRCDPKKISALVREKKFNGALVFKRRGEMFIWDGHHRSSAAMKAGKETIRVRLVDLPDNEPLSLQQFANRFKIDKWDIIAAMDSQDRIDYENID